MGDWILRIVKGVFIGAGFIVPGVSGGALAAVFGIYERMIAFLSKITKDFKKNLLFFFPVGIGILAGIFLFSKVLVFLLTQYAAEMRWFFVGCIVGTAPSLWKEAGKKGRQTKHYGIIGISFVVGMLFLILMKGIQVTIPQNIFTWAAAGALIGLGMLLPGLSPSNLLVFFGMYDALSAGIASLDWSVIIPLFFGVGSIALILAKLIEKILNKAYTGMFHIILGIVFASTIMIIPVNVNYLSIRSLFFVLALAIGVALGLWMSKLEKRYKPKAF